MSNKEKAMSSTTFDVIVIGAGPHGFHLLPAPPAQQAALPRSAR
jgi:hypothetical protein